MTRIERWERFQRGHAWLGFPLAVVYKSFDDRTSRLAAQVTYYAVVSLFPMLLLFISAAGLVLQGHPQARAQVVASAVRNLPAVGVQLRKSLGNFHGSGAALAVGLVGTVYGALGATTTAQMAFNQMYGVPRYRQPNPLVIRLRGLALLLLLGLFVLVSTGLAAITATANGLSARFGVGAHVAIYTGTFALDVGLFTVAFQLLTSEELHLRDVLAGGVIAGAAWELLQTVGARYLALLLSRGTALYGVFGAVLASIAWIYLETLALMLAAEVNCVRQRRLWPRALLGQFADGVPFTPADLAPYRQYLQAWRFKESEDITVTGPVGAGDSDVHEPRRGARTKPAASSESEFRGCGCREPRPRTSGDHRVLADEVWGAETSGRKRL